MILSSQQSFAKDHTSDTFGKRRFAAAQNHSAGAVARDSPCPARRRPRRAVRVPDTGQFSAYNGMPKRSTACRALARRDVKG